MQRNDIFLSQLLSISLPMVTFRYFIPTGPQRDPETVEITLTRSWKDAFGITSSVEYRDLSVQVTSEVRLVVSFFVGF